jgi:hypothetical protein
MRSTRSSDHSGKPSGQRRDPKDANSPLAQNTEANNEAGKARRLANLRPPFKPGQSGNPGGRPKRRLIDEALTELLLTEDSKIAEAIARALVRKAKRGDLRAIQLTAERVQGKPKQAMELSGVDGEPMRFENMSNEQLDSRLKELLEKWQTDHP